VRTNLLKDVALATFNCPETVTSLAAVRMPFTATFPSSDACWETVREEQLSGPDRSKDPDSENTPATAKFPLTVTSLVTVISF
jgi:hypothetical protein